MCIRDSHGGQRQAQGLRDGRMGHAFQAVEQEGVLDRHRQAVEQPVDLDHRLPQHEQRLGRGRHRLGFLRQRLQVAGLDIARAPQVDGQAPRQRQQIGARLGQRRAGGRREDAAEGVLRQVGGVGAVVDAPVQPAEEPVVVFRVCLLYTSRCV